MSGLEGLASRLTKKLTGRSPDAIAPIAQGVMTYKFLVERGDEKYVVRIFPLGREEAGLVEAALLSRCRKAGMMTPELLVAGEFEGARCTVYRYINGRSLQDTAAGLGRQAIDRLAAQIADQLQIMAELPVTGFGDLASASSGKHRTLSAHLIATASRALEARTELPNGLREVAERVATWTPRRPGVRPPQLIWGDISPENIIVNADGALAGLIDFEGAFIAGRAATLGFLEARYPDDAFTGALRGALSSASAHHRSAVHSYTVLRALRMWPFLAEPLPTGLARAPIESVLPGLSRAVVSLLNSDLEFES